MAESKWELYKMKEDYKLISVDEIVIFFIGVMIFAIEILRPYRVYFIGLVILWYWLKIRHAETRVYKKRQEIYNVFYDKIRPVPQEIIEKETEKARKPLEYQLEQLEHQRKSLIDKFVIINLILVILIQLFITN
ncbi:MAG: hypothetical protein PHH01_04565 [Patescibacteria group bacterium]|nr:hypothetical protein [Patescibacteria group bacterium]